MQPSSAALAVVAAPIPAADRRGLSQAWYSALHLAGSDPGLSPRRSAPSAASAMQPAATPLREPGIRPEAQYARNTAARVPSLVTPPALQAPERRVGPTALAKRIVRAVTARNAPRATASLTVASENGRVQLVVRVDGGRTRVVALCAAADRADVTRALGAARFALANRGATVTIDVRTAE